MTELRYTLLADGSSDRALLPILSWTLQQQGVSSAIQATWADLGRLRHRPRTLSERIIAALELYPCDLLFVHRDAEREPFENRHTEIERALLEVARQEVSLPSAVCVIPVRMHEAWLLFNEWAIRMAAGNPRGRQEGATTHARSWSWRSRPSATGKASAARSSPGSSGKPGGAAKARCW